MSLFSLILGLGASLGLFRLLQSAEPETRIRWLVAGLLTFLGALVGARLGFALLFHEYFKTAWTEIFNIELGGLFWPGAVPGAILFAWMGCALLRLPRLTGLDRLSRMLLPLGVAAWMASWQVGVAYGHPLQAGTWWGMMSLDESGQSMLRVPIQPAAILSLLVLVLVVEFLVRKTPKPGLPSAVVGVAFFAHTLLFSLMRADPTRLIYGLRWETWSAILFLALSISILLFTLFKKTNIPGSKT